MLRFYAKAALNNAKTLGNKINIKKKEFDLYLKSQNFIDNTFINTKNYNNPFNSKDFKEHNKNKNNDFNNIKSNPFYWTHLCISKIKSITSSIFSIFKSDKMLDYEETGKNTNNLSEQNKEKKNNKMISFKSAISAVIYIKNKVTNFLVMVNAKQLIKYMGKTLPVLIKNTSSIMISVSKSSKNFLVAVKNNIDNKYRSKDVENSFKESSKNFNNALIKFSEKLVPLSNKIKSYSFVDKAYTKVKNTIGLSSKISRMNKIIQSRGTQRQFRIYYEHFKDKIKNSPFANVFSFKSLFNLSKNFKYKIIALFVIYIFYKLFMLYMRYYRVNDYGINSELSEIREMTKSLKEQNESIIKSNHNLQYMLELELEKNKKLLEKLNK